MTQIAVIYCRVSSPAQVKKGDGLQSQETRCREYIGHKGYVVAQVFNDEGVSGGVINRPGMQAMLKYLRKIRHEQPVVIIDDISRLARGLQAHLELRTAIDNAGAKLESPSIEFGEDSDSQLVENLLASVSQHSRQKNAEQVKHRMRARMMNGYWVFHKPIGYCYKHVSGHGKMLVRDEPVASLVKEALESYACGRFNSQAEIKRHLEAHSVFPKSSDGVRYQKIQEMLERVLYAGYIDHPEWDITLQQGKHEPLISFDTWQKIQLRLKDQTKTPNRKDIALDFPLRGFVLCDTCQQPMTSCWAQGKFKKFAYYHCRNKACPDAKKSIPKPVMEKQFVDMLEELCPKPELVFMARQMWQAQWDDRIKNRERDKVQLQENLRRADHKIEQFLNRIVETDSDTLVKTYEGQVRKLEIEKRGLTEKIAACGTVVAMDFNHKFGEAMKFLEDPLKLWCSDQLCHKRMAIKLTFADRLVYRRNFGFQTPNLSLPFLLLQGFQEGKNKVVENRRVELLTSTMPS